MLGKLAREDLQSIYGRELWKIVCEAKLHKPHARDELCEFILTKRKWSEEFLEPVAFSLGDIDVALRAKATISLCAIGRSAIDDVEQFLLAANDEIYADYAAAAKFLDSAQSRKIESLRFYDVLNLRRAQALRLAKLILNDPSEFFTKDYISEDVLTIFELYRHRHHASERN